MAKTKTKNTLLIEQRNGAFFYTLNYDGTEYRTIKKSGHPTEAAAKSAAQQKLVKQLNGSMTTVEQLDPETQHVSQVKGGCKFCGREIKGRGPLAQHERQCEQNPDRVPTRRERGIRGPDKPGNDIKADRRCQFCGEMKHYAGHKNHENFCEQNPNRMTSRPPRKGSKNVEIEVLGGAELKLYKYDGVWNGTIKPPGHNQIKVRRGSKAAAHRAVMDALRDLGIEVDDRPPEHLVPRVNGNGNGHRPAAIAANGHDPKAVLSDALSNLVGSGTLTGSDMPAVVEWIDATSQLINAAAR